MIFALACNKPWYKYLVVDLYSLLKNNKRVKKVYLFLETNKIEEVENLSFLQNKYDVDFVLINFLEERNKYISKGNPNVDTPYTDFAFCKLILADYIKEDRVIYLDTDAIVKKDLSRLWDTNIEDYYVAGCKDLGVILSGYYPKLNIKGRYINTGVMYLNLKKIREENLIPVFFKLLNEKKLKYPDQDAFNIICQDKELYISSIYNHVFSITRQIGNTSLVKIWHFAGPKEQWVVDKTYAEEWFEVEEEFFYLLKNQ